MGASWSIASVRRWLLSGVDFATELKSWREYTASALYTAIQCLYVHETSGMVGNEHRFVIEHHYRPPEVEGGSESNRQARPPMTECTCSPYCYVPLYEKLSSDKDVEEPSDKHNPAHNTALFQQHLQPIGAMIAPQGGDQKRGVTHHQTSRARTRITRQTQVALRTASGHHW